MEDVHGQSDLFKTAGGWRGRKNRGDASPGAKEDGAFAQGLDDVDDPLLARKPTVIVEDGIFGSSDVKGGDEGTTKLPGGLFDNSDDEAEIVASKMEDAKAAEAAEKKKNAGMFDLDDEEEDDYGARNVANQIKKK